MSTVKRLPVGPVQPSGKPSPRDKLTVGEVCAELQIAQSTFYEWRAKGTGPRCIKLPNGQLRVRRADLEAWLDAREDVA
jgi:predicted DNA-binding transcriptional regulator AlpA